MPAGANGSGAPKAGACTYAPSSAVGSPMTDQNRPCVSVPKSRPETGELMMIWLPLSGLTAKFDPPRLGHCGSRVVGGPVTDCSRPKVRPTPSTWKKLVPPPPQHGQLYW